jgi:DNA transposition AAA+ family ATPase
MKHELAKTKNVRQFLSAASELMNRPLGVEGMGLLWGKAGEGKTSVVAYAANWMDGIFLRARSGWTPTAMLGDLVIELGGEPMSRRHPMTNWIIGRLASSDRRIIFIDEADYLLEQTSLLDTMRDIYDLTGTAVMLIGMEGMARGLQKQGRERFARRITQWVEFKGIDFDDARILADTVCECGVADDLLKHLHHMAKANIGLMVVGLSRIERVARLNGLDGLTLEDWGDKQLFFSQPRFRGQE